MPCQSTEIVLTLISGFAGCEVLELNVQADHVHLVVMIPSNVSVSFIGPVEGSDIDEAVSSISVFEENPYLGTSILRRTGTAWTKFGWMRPS